MAIPKKYQRLLSATQRFNTFNYIVDAIPVGLFLWVALASANKLLTKKLIEHPWFNASWTLIGVCFGIFLVLFFSQISRLERRRALSAFEAEAAAKAQKIERRRRR